MKFYVGVFCLNLLLQEKIEFIKGMKLQPNLSLTRKEDYYFGMEKAFDDAFNQYARREKKKYATAKQTLMEPIVDRLFKYFNSAEDNFNSCFNDCIALLKQILNNNRYGVAQNSQICLLSIYLTACGNHKTCFRS